MFGDNVKRAPIKGDGQVLAVQEIFRTIQGEGPFSGVAAVFIRLGGCNLACKFCDTEFESFKDWALKDIIAEVEKLAEHVDLVVITGGEPLRQPIKPLCDELLSKSFNVQIETNGTLYRELDERVSLVCSPKNTGMGYQPIRDDLLQRLLAIKFVVSKHDPLYEEVAEVGQSKYNIPVYVQPMDEHDKPRTKDNVKYARALSLKHNYHLSLQLHKIMGVK